MSVSRSRSLDCRRRIWSSIRPSSLFDRSKSEEVPVRREFIYREPLRKLQIELPDVKSRYAPGEAVQAHMPGTRAALRREVQFQAKVYGLTEGGNEFVEETVVCDLSLQGAMLTLKHLPQLQSELQLTIDAPGTNGEGRIRLKGYVVRIDDAQEKGSVAVGVVFTE